MIPVGDDLLRSMEALVVGCQGGSRPHLRALQFGGATKLARELAAFLNSGSIHRERTGEETCLPYLRSLYFPMNGHLLRSKWDLPKDLVDWFVDMIVNASLSDALVAITFDLEKLSEHYEKTAPILSKQLTNRLVQGAKYLDEMDADGLADIQLSNIASLTRAPSTDQPVRPSLLIKAPKSKFSKTKRSENGSKEVKSEKKSRDHSEKKVILSNRLSSSCPCLTEIGFKRFLQSRNWSLPESDTVQMSTGIPMAQDNHQTFKSEGLENSFSDLGARPKKRNGNLNGHVDTNGHTPGSNTSKAGSRVEPRVKRRTHKRSASDTEVGKNLARTLSVKPSTRKEMSNIKEEDLIEGYEEGPNFFMTTGAFPGSTFPSTGGGWSELRPPSGGWQLPQPADKEQSLLNYIISGKFSKHQASLDQENAHIILAEAVINASSGKNLALASPDDRQANLLNSCGRLNSSSRNEDARPLNGERGKFDKEVEALTQDCIPDRTSNCMASHNGSPFRARSAEATALQLLLNLKNPHQLKASELKFLVSEKEAPQELLPLPSSFVAFSSAENNPSNRTEHADIVDENFEDATELRGNQFWAPPRPQVILKIHLKRNTKESVKQQNFFCHDCGMRVEPAFVHTFRFCYYFGKYSCTTCHTNKTHILPANVIHKWDFKEYRVSDFAFIVLERLSGDPLFRVEDLNPKLVKRITKLKNSIALRDQAYRVAKYLITCRFASSLSLELDDLFNVSYSGFFSLKDLFAIKVGTYEKNLRKQIETATEHVLNCELCSGRGYLCEGCHTGSTLFPFQTLDVYQCDKCFACYHTKCVKQPCTKCVRLQERSDTETSSSTNLPTLT